MRSPNRMRSPFFALVLSASWACADASTPASDTAKEAPGKAAANAPVADAEPAAPLPEAAELLRKAVDAVGGKAKLDAIETIHFTGRISIAGQNIGGDLAIWWKDGEFYMETTMVGLGRVRAGKQGDRVWSEDPILGLRTLTGKEAEQAQWQSALFLAADWERYFGNVQTTGERELDGKKVYDVKLTSNSGDEVVMTFDAESGLQVAMELAQASPMGPMPVKMKMEDYRDVDGMKVAFRQVTDASLATMTQEVTKIEFNSPVDESRFAMPTAPNAGPPPPASPAADAKQAPGQPAPKKTMMPFGPDGKPGMPVPDKGKKR